jgi:hypothetical protein
MQAQEHSHLWRTIPVWSAGSIPQQNGYGRGGSGLPVPECQAAQCQHLLYRKGYTSGRQYGGPVLRITGPTSPMLPLHHLAGQHGHHG